MGVGGSRTGALSGEASSWKRQRETTRLNLHFAAAHNRISASTFVKRQEISATTRKIWRWMKDSATTTRNMKPNTPNRSPLVT